MSVIRKIFHTSECFMIEKVGRNPQGGVYLRDSLSQNDCVKNSRNHDHSFTLISSEFLNNDLFQHE